MNPPATIPPPAGPAAKAHHTPATYLPWGIEETTQTIYVGPLRRDGSGKIADIVCYFNIFAIKDEALKRHMQNAAFIVEACNQHAALTARVAQLEGALRAILPLAELANDVEPVGGPDENCGVNRAQVEIDHAKAALDATPERKTT